MRDFFTELRSAILALVVLSVLTGVVYPVVVTVIARVALADRADGSIVTRDGVAVGSSLVGQAFGEPRYFWTRPSAISPTAYDAMASSADNLGPSNPDLAKAVADRIAALRAADPGNPASVPVDLVTTSASGLDPDISPAAAYYQASRVARERGLALDRVQALVGRHVEGRWLGVFGDPHVNVLALNLDLDTLAVATR